MVRFRSPSSDEERAQPAAGTSTSSSTVAMTVEDCAAWSDEPARPEVVFIQGAACYASVTLTEISLDLSLRTFSFATFIQTLQLKNLAQQLQLSNFIFASLAQHTYKTSLWLIRRLWGLGRGGLRGRANIFSKKMNLQ